MSADPVSRPTRPSAFARLHRAAMRIDWMLLFPVVAAIAWLFGQDAVAMVMVTVLPVCLLMGLGARRAQQMETARAADLASGRPVSRSVLLGYLDGVLDECARRDRTTAIMLLQVDDLVVADGEWGVDLGGRIMDTVTARVQATMRGQDAVIRCAEDMMAVVLSPTRRVDLDVAMDIVDRVQAAVAEPVSIDGRVARVRACVGICSAAMAPHLSGGAMLAAADCALRIARRAGDDAVRSFNPDMQTRIETDHRLASQIEEALENGEIRPWFQPQIDAISGGIAGLEALARWHHPDLGVLTPGQFLSPLQQAGLSAELGEVVLRRTLEALVEWDREGIDVPCVGVNLTLEELSDPRLAERIIWQVDRFGLEPGRIAVEILETVTLRDGDETIVRNIRALRQAGFRLDLDDFGTGAASIAHIARFGVHRIKIDRSFVHGLDTDETRRKVVAAILSLARELGIETLAEGVETPEEQAVLADLGCPHLQGFGLARPMPQEEILPWARNRTSTSARALGRMAVRGTA